MTPEQEATDWGVFVDECGIFAVNGPAADWWAEFYIRARPGMITELVLTPAGGHHHVAAPTKDDAEFMREYMISKGVHNKHVKVQRLSVAKATADKRAKAFDEKTERLRAWMKEEES